MSNVNQEFGREDTPGVEVVMRKLFSLAVMCSLAFPTMAFAQGPESPKEAADDLDAEYGREETVDSAAEVPAEPPPKEAEMKMPESPKMAADDIGLEEPDVGGSWKDGLSWQVMASAFYRIGGYTNNGVRAGTYNNILSTDTPTAGYPYTNYNGFGLNFAGGDVMYTGEKFAVRLDLRFGEGAGLLSPIAPIKQAYAAWMPSEKVSIDVGFFDTVFGAEVADEWNNANYTRGALYFLRQPFNHMGLRMGAELGKIVGFTAMVTNGGVYGGTPIDDNETPALAWQFGFSPDGHNSVRRRGLREGTRDIGLFFGGNHAASGLNGNKDWVSFFDVVLAMDFDWFHLVLNGDYYLDGNNTNLAGAKASDFQFGHSLAFIFDASDQWSIGLRGENVSGNELYREAGGGFGGLSTGTITLRYKPVEYLVISLEGRGEWATRDVYLSRQAAPILDASCATVGFMPDKGHNYAAIIGVTAHIGN